MKPIQSLTLIIILLALNSCFGSKEDPLEIERKEFVKSLEEDSPLAIYKGIKVSIRSFPISGGTEVDSAAAKEAVEVSGYTGHLIKKILGTASDSSINLSISDGIEILSTLNRLKGELKDTDEDTFPTIFEVLLNVNNAENYPGFLDHIQWHNSKEHLAMGVLMMAAQPLPKSFQLYEVSKVDIEKLEKTEVKPAAAIIKGTSLLLNKWYYLSEEALTQGINSLENEQLVFVTKVYQSMFDDVKIDSEEALKTELHAFSCLLRGFARSRMDDEDKNELALEDFELFLADAEKLGLDNELVWLAGTYVNIKKENSEEAIVYLNKMKQSNFINNNEKAAIDNIISYLGNREPDKALNTIYDKLFIGKMMVRYLNNYYKKISWYKELELSETGKRFLEIPKVMEEEYNKFNSGLDTDKLQEQGKKLLDNLF